MDSQGYRERTREEQFWEWIEAAHNRRRIFGFAGRLAASRTYQKDGKTCRGETFFEPEDIVFEAIMKLRQSLDRIDDFCEGVVMRCLFQCLVQVAQKPPGNKTGKTTAEGRDWWDRGRHAGDGEIFESIPADEISAEEMLVDNSIKENLAKAITEVLAIESQRHRAMWERRYVDGLSLEEVAESVGTSLPTDDLLTPTELRRMADSVRNQLARVNKRIVNRFRALEGK